MFRIPNNELLRYWHWILNLMFTIKSFSSSEYPFKFNVLLERRLKIFWPQYLLISYWNIIAMIYWNPLQFDRCDLYFYRQNTFPRRPSNLIWPGFFTPLLGTFRVLLFFKQFASTVKMKFSATWWTGLALQRKSKTYTNYIWWKNYRMPLAFL